MSYVDQTPNQETKIELIRTLQSVTEGKVRPHGCWAPFRAPDTNKAPRQLGLLGWHDKLHTAC